MADADRDAGDEGGSERFTPYTDPADREVRIDADDVEDAVVTALAGLIRELLEAEGEADVQEILGGIEHTALVDATEFTVQGWIDDALNQLQAEGEIEYIGRAGAYRATFDVGGDPQ
jgi:hypothetical protein